MPSPDHSTTPMPTNLPQPPSGVGAADLATDSNDPEELRALLERARERLAFYESFDRIIGENIRRSGELMVETVALREQAQALAAQSAKDRAAFEATRQADRERYRTLVQTALDEAATIMPVVDAMVGKLQDALGQIDRNEEPQTGIITTQAAPDQPETSILTEPDAPETATAEAAPAELSATEPVTPAEETEPAAPESTPAAESENTGPRTIQVLAHQVPNAKTAIALQKMLRGLDTVTNVDAREFANGELRLAVTATGSIDHHILTGWLADNNGQLTSTTDIVTEVSFQDS